VASEMTAVGTVEVGNLSTIQKRAIEVLGGGGTLADVAGLRAEDIETIHAIGENFYNQAQYDQAEPMFQFACFYAHLEPRYWMSLGKCRQMTKNYQGAIDAYAMSHMRDAGNAWPPIQAAICCLALNEKGAAAEALALAESAVKARPDETARQRILALRQAL